MFPSFNTNFKLILVSNQILSSKHLQEEGGLFIPYFCTFLHLSCLQLRYTISFLLGVECSRSYPFAYLNGWYCCKTKEERPTSYGITPQHEIKSGTCDGKHFNRQSVCCKDEKYTRCSDKNKCLDYNGRTGNHCIMHPQSLLLTHTQTGNQSCTGGLLIVRVLIPRKNRTNGNPYYQRSFHDINW